MAPTPAVTTTTTIQPIAATTSAGPPKNGGQVVTRGLPAAAIGSKPGSVAKLRPICQPKTDEAMIELALNTRQHGPLLPQPYQQTNVYPPPNRPGATALPTMWPLPSRSESMAWIVSRSSSSSTCSSSTRIKLTKMKRPSSQQPNKRKKKPEGRELCDGKEIATVAQTLLSLASASCRNSASTMAHWQERQGKNNSRTDPTSTPTSRGQQSIQI